MRILPYRTNENVIDGLVVTFVDITRIKGLQEGERRLLEALKRSSTTVFGQDLELRFTWSWSSVFGRKLEELVGKTDADLLPAEQAKTLAEIKRGVIASKASTRRRLTLTPQREDRVYDLYVEPMSDARGAIVGVSCVVTDITALNPES
jgi:two-component system CheB/CheR fusion protein